MIIENRRMSGDAEIIIENEVRCNIGAAPNREQDIALIFF